MEKMQCLGGCGKIDYPNGVGDYIWVQDYDHVVRVFLCEECDRPLGYPNGLAHLLTLQQFEEAKLASALSYNRSLVEK
jgi:hypothetical protein